MQLKYISWSGTKMDPSFAAIADIIAKHFDGKIPSYLTIRVTTKQWDWMRNELAKWNQASINAPIACYFNLLPLEGEHLNFPYDWSVEDTATCVEIAEA